MNYTIASCEEMDLNPFDLKPGQMIWDRYPVIGRKDSFRKIPSLITSDWYKGWTEEDQSNLVRFVILFVDTQSPFYDKKDFDYRRKLALELLNFKGDSLVTREVNAETDHFHAVVTDFFKIINEVEYETWFSQKMNMHHLNYFLRRQPDDENIIQNISARKQISAMINELTYKLVEMEMSLFPDKRLQRIINTKAEEEDVGGFPEMFALDPEYDVKAN